METGFIRVSLHIVLENFNLMVSIEDAEQAKLGDALGSSILWQKDFTFLE